LRDFRFYPLRGFVFGTTSFAGKFQRFMSADVPRYGGYCMFEYKPRGTCSTKITFDITEGKIHRIAFKDGCEGNLRGIAKLAEGMDARQLASLLKGTPCGRRGTSCPDQLAIAIEQALAETAR
jgi:uncharacterized protein (TIGR03905 family)